MTFKLSELFESCAGEINEKCSNDVVLVIVALVIVLILVLFAWWQCKKAKDATIAVAAAERMRILRGNQKEHAAIPRSALLGNSNAATPSSMGRKQLNDQANLDYTSSVGVGQPVVVAGSNFGYVTREMGSGGIGANPVNAAAGLERMDARALAKDLDPARREQMHPGSLAQAYMAERMKSGGECPPMVWSPYLNDYVPDPSSGYQGNVWADAYTQSILTGDTSGLKELVAI